MEERHLTFRIREEGERLDSFLTRQMHRVSRSYVQELIKSGKVLVNGEVKNKPSYKIKRDEIVEVIIPSPRKLDVEPEDLPIEIVYEDKDIIVVNKPQGMLTHPVGRQRTGTLVNALLFHSKDLSGIGGVLRPGIVHRLDRDTSGLLIVAKNDFSHRILSRNLKERKIKRIYWTLVKGEISEDEGEIEIPLLKGFTGKKLVTPSLRGKEAFTYFKVIERFKGYTLLEVSLKTGRTHQIRVHLSYIGYPIVGDKMYGVSEFNLKGQLLHAKKIVFTHPRTKELMSFETPLPDYFSNVLEMLEKRDK